MKRNIFTQVIALFVFTSMVISQTGCTQEKIEFQQGQHPGCEIYTETFNTYTYNSPQFQLHIEEQLYEEESAKEWVALIQADIEALAITFGTGEPSKFFIVQQTSTEEVPAGNGAIYCTPEDINNGGYRNELVKAYLGITELWKITGVNEALFGENPDQEALADYYSDVENHATLSLFAAYFDFDTSFMNSQTIITDTASAFTNFLLSEHGGEAFLGCTSQDRYRQAWLDSLNLSVAYQPAYDLKFLDEAVYSSNDQYSLIITTDDRVYAFSEGFAETAEDIMYLLSFYHEGMEIAMGYISENAPDHADQIAIAWEELDAIYFQSDIYGSYADQTGKEMHVGNASLRALFRTTFNFLIPEADREMEIWKTSGVADYLYAMAEQPDVAFYNYFLSELNESWEDDKVYLELVQDYCLDHEDYPAALKDFNFDRFYEGMAVITMNYPELELFSNNFAKYSIARWSGSEAKYKPYTGNTLTYPEAYLFTKYLVETYGLDNMLTYCMTYSTMAFTNSFGVSYTTALSDFRSMYIISE